MVVAAGTDVDRSIYLRGVLCHDLPLMRTSTNPPSLPRASYHVPHLQVELPADRPTKES